MVEENSRKKSYISNKEESLKQIITNVEDELMYNDLSLEKMEKLWELVNKIEVLYCTREYNIPQVAEALVLPGKVVSRTLKELNYDHTLKRTTETRLNGKLIKGIQKPEDFRFLMKYLQNE